MKKLVMFVCFVIVSCLPAWASLADSAPKQVPLADVATLKAFALTQINYVSGGVQGASVSGNPWFSNAYTPDASRPAPAALSAAVKKNALSFSVDPTDRLSSYVGYEIRMPDGISWTAFWQQEDYSLIKNPDGSFSLPPVAIRLDSMEFS